MRQHLEPPSEYVDTAPPSEYIDTRVPSSDYVEIYNDITTTTKEHQPPPPLPAVADE